MFVTYFVQLTSQTTSEFFDIYSNVSPIPILSGISKAQLTIGVFVSIPYNANLIIVKSTDNCQATFNISITPGTTTTTSTTSTTTILECTFTAVVAQIYTTTTTAPPTTTTTTIAPPTTTTTTSTTTQYCPPPCNTTSTSTSTSTTTTTTTLAECDFTGEILVPNAPYSYNVCVSDGVHTSSCANACTCDNTTIIYTRVPFGLGVSIYLDANATIPANYPFISYLGDCYDTNWNETFTEVYVENIMPCL